MKEKSKVEFTSLEACILVFNHTMNNLINAVKFQDDGTAKLNARMLDYAKNVKLLKNPTEMEWMIEHPEVHNDFKGHIINHPFTLFEATKVYKHHLEEMLRVIIYSKKAEVKDMIYTYRCLSGFMERMGRLPVRSEDRHNIIVYHQPDRFFTLTGDRYNGYSLISEIDIDIIGG